MTNQLIALLDGREVGTVTHKSGRLSFTFAFGRFKALVDILDSLY